MSDDLEINRTEGEALRHQAVDIVLGGRSFALRPLTMFEDVAWLDAHASLDEWAQSVVGSNASLSRNVRTAFALTQRQLELICAYDVDNVLGGVDAASKIARPGEVEPAYAAIRRVAIPFVGTLDDPTIAALYAALQSLVDSAQESSPPNSSDSSPDSEPGGTSNESSPEKPST